MRIRSKERPELWYSFSDEIIMMSIDEDVRAWSWSQMGPMTDRLLPRIKKELDRYAEAYRILRKTPEENRTLDWRAHMANIMGFTYGDLQTRIQQGYIVWEEVPKC